MDLSDLDTHLIHGSLDQNELVPKLHLYVFSHFCTDRETDTHHAMCNIFSNRLYLFTACL